MRKFFSAVGLLIGLTYLVNPTAGIIELIPDNLPFIGNLDEVAAVILVLKCLTEFGIVIVKKKPKSEENKLKTL